MKKNLIKISVVAFAAAMFFLNINVVMDTEAESNFQLSAISDVFAQTASSTASSATSSAASSATSSATSSTASSAVSSAASSTAAPSSGEYPDMPPPPSSWGSTNPWATGQNFYFILVEMTAGQTIQDISKDGGVTWAFNASLFGQGFTIGNQQGSGSTITRTITFTSSFTLKCCRPGGTSRCDFPAC